MPPDPDRHAVLADPTRRALVLALRAAPGPLGVRDLAAGLGLHPNSVRDQLRRLAAAGLVRVTTAPPDGRGRPGLRYAAVPDPEDPFRALAGALADQVSVLPDPAGAWEAAGERWGRSVAGGDAGGSVPAEAPSGPDTIDPERRAADALTGVLAAAGFAPDPITPNDPEVRLRACPFLPLERRHLPVVCGVHLGFIRGALRELGSSRDAVSIEPLVEPDLCVARLGRTPDA